MAGEEIRLAQQSIAITDPGEVERNQHVWGDRLMIRVGNVVAWLFPILMIAICTQVVIRKMGFNQAWLDDAQWWLYGIAMLTGFGYAITTQSHVRVDIFHANYSLEKKAKTEIFAVGWLLLPFMIFMADILIHYAYSSWLAGEGSDSPNGLHMLYLLKISLPILFLCAITAAFAVLYRQVRILDRPTLFNMILAGLPAFLFIAERVIRYVFYWIIALTDPEINSRRITREPVFDYVFYMAVVVIAALALYAFIRARNARSGA